jgi:hypothetical protein
VVVAGLTTSGSQLLVAALLFESPEYIAFQEKLPAVLNVRDAEFGTAPLVTVTVDTIVEVPLQSLVENRS